MGGPGSGPRPGHGKGLPVTITKINGVLKKSYSKLHTPKSAHRMKMQNKQHRVGAHNVGFLPPAKLLHIKESSVSHRVPFSGEISLPKGFKGHR